MVKATAEEKALAKEVKKELALKRAEELALARQERIEEEPAKPEKKLITYMAKVECCDIPALPPEIKNAVNLLVEPSEVMAIPKPFLTPQRHVALLRDVRREADEKPFEKSKIDFAPDGTFKWTIPCGREFSVGPLKAQDEDDARMRVRRSYRKPHCQVLEINEV